MRIAIITGASAGIGVEFFKAVDATCHDIEEIWVIARRTERLKALASSSGKSVLPLSLDLTDMQQLERLQETLAEKSPDVALLINNAGYGKLGNVDELDPFDQMNMCSLNCGALTAVTAMTLPYMSRGAAVLNVASIAAFQPNPRMTVYSSTKAYVFSFSKGLRYELKGRGINVFAVCPGPMETEFLSLAGIGKGASHQFDTLPRCDPSLVALRSVKKARSGKAVYTNKLLFKLYRVITKILPHNITIPLGKC